jgi:AAA+ superfamily predicted ATPase
LEYIKNFLSSPNVDDCTLQEHLKCNEDEFNILKFLLTSYLKGKEIVSAATILVSVFGNDKLSLDEFDNFDFSTDLSLLSKSESIRDLVKKGLLVCNIGFNELVEMTTVEIINCSFSLSRFFLLILENGKPDFYEVEDKPYESELAYIKHQFKRVEYYQALSHFCNTYHESHKAIEIIEKNIELIETDIKNRTEISDIELKLNEFFVENEFLEKEQIIFLALLKNEYLPTESFSTLSSLIDLISVNEDEKLQNRNLLSSESKLIQDGFVYVSDELFMNDLSGYFIDKDILDTLDVFANTKPKRKTKSKTKIQDIIEEQDIFEYVEPKTTLDDVVLNPETSNTLQNLLKQVDNKVLSRLKKWGIKDKKSGISSKIIFYGVAGTGKTMTAHSLAKSLKRGVLSFDCSKVLSMYIGESEKNVRKIFDDFKDISKQMTKEPILLLNEADQFLSTRTTTSGSGSEKMHNQMQNIFLEQIEKFDGILIATTNLLETIDKAFSRRFNYKIEFKKPNFDQRISLWNKLLPKDAPLEDIDSKKLAKHELTGGQIELIIKNTAYKVACKDEPLFTMKDFTEEIEKEKNSSFDSQRQMGFEL